MRSLVESYVGRPIAIFDRLVDGLELFAIAPIHVSRVIWINMLLLHQRMIESEETDRALHQVLRKIRMQLLLTLSHQLPFVSVHRVPIFFTRARLAHPQ